MELVEPVLKNIYQSKTYSKDLSWPHFDNKPRLQEKQQVKDQQSCIVAFQVATRGSSQEVTKVFLPWCMVDLQRYRATSGERNVIEQIKAPIFLEEFQQQRYCKSPYPIQKRNSTPASKKIIFPQEQTYPFSHHQNQYHQTSQMKPVEFSHH